MDTKVWHRIFENWIECHESIKTLASNNIIEEDEQQVLDSKLLNEIISTMRDEITE